MSASFASFLSLIGLYTFVYYLYDVLKAPITVIFHKLKMCVGYNEFNIKEKYGEWAAITGCTDGIGKGYARELAARGINIVLISRSEERLKMVAKEIETDFYVKTKVIVADFSTGKEACRHVEKQLDLTPIRILVNNVGQTTAEPGPLGAYTDDEIWSVIFTNIGAVTQLSRYFMKRLYKENLTGIIVNVGSGTGHFPVPNNALYAATKVYVRHLTLALQEEGRPHGIDVQLLSPHFVATKFINYANVVKYSHIFLPKPMTFARAAVGRLGIVADTTGYFQHDLEYAALKACPWRLGYFIMNLIGKAISPSIELRKL